MNDTEQRNLIWRVIALTTSILTLITVLVVVLCAILIPRTYGDFISALGFKNAGLVSYEYNYHKRLMNYPNEINEIIKSELTSLIEMKRNLQDPFEKEIIDYYYKIFKNIEK